MSENVCCWRIQVAYNLTDIQQARLVQSLAGVNGAITECLGWGMAKAPAPPPSIKAFTFVNLRALMLHKALLQPVFDGDGCSVNPEIVLRIVINETYEGERPEMTKLPQAFPGDDFFYSEHFWPLYLDSLLLRRDDVRAYCRK